MQRQASEGRHSRWKQVGFVSPKIECIHWGGIDGPKEKNEEKEVKATVDKLPEMKRSPSKRKKSRAKSKRQLSPVRQKAKENAKTFLRLVKSIEELIQEEETDEASSQLDKLVNHVENTHYLNSEKRKQHVRELYRLNESLENLEQQLKETTELHRQQGNTYLKGTAKALLAEDFEQAYDLTEKAMVEYRKADDSRWITLKVLKERILGDQLGVKAEREFDRGDLANALQTAKEVQVKYRDYKRSKLAGQCQLVLSVAAASTEWQMVRSPAWYEWNSLILNTIRRRARSPRLPRKKTSG